MTFIDTHAHLYDEAFGTDIDSVLGRCAAAGIEKMIMPDIDRNSRDSMFSLAGRHPGKLYATLGIHPTSVDSGWENDFEEMCGYIGRDICAIGETGIDCHWSKEYIKEQKECFRQHIELACRTGLPVIVHCREATEHIVAVLKECRHLCPRGVFHAFSGSMETFREISSTGDWFAGIGGVLTYRNASIAETVKSIPLERIVLETDSPYLTPVPHRGKRNESSYIPVIASALAAIKGCDEEEIAARTTANAIDLFNL